MKPELNTIESVLDSLEELHYISQFAMYESFGHNKKKLRKKLKKLIEHVKNDDPESYLDMNYYLHEGE